MVPPNFVAIGNPNSAFRAPPPQFQGFSTNRGNYQQQLMHGNRPTFPHQPEQILYSRMPAPNRGPVKETFGNDVDELYDGGVGGTWGTNQHQPYDGRPLEELHGRSHPPRRHIRSPSPRRKTPPADINRRKDAYANRSNRSPKRRRERSPSPRRETPPAENNRRKNGRNWSPGQRRDRSPSPRPLTPTQNNLTSNRANNRSTRSPDRRNAASPLARRRTSPGPSDITPVPALSFLMDGKVHTRVNMLQELRRLSKYY